MEVNERFVLKYISPLKQLQTITFHEGFFDMDFQRFFRSLDKLSEIIFECYFITINVIKKILRRIVQPLDVSIRIRVKCWISSDFSNSDFDEITDLLRPCPEIKFVVEITDRLSLVSNFSPANELLHQYKMFCFVTSTDS